MAAKNFHGAYDVITDTNLLPSVCGRVCPQENQCEGVCTVGESLEPVAIGRLERFVGDMAIAEGWANIPTSSRTASRSASSLRSGRHGLRGGHGQGRLRGDRLRGVSRARRRTQVRHPGLPAAESRGRCRDRETHATGHQVRVQHARRRLFTIEQMLGEMGFHAVFVGTGAGYPSFMGIPGESLGGVLSANEWLTRCNLMRGRDFPNFDTPLQPASAWPSSARATRRWTRCASRCASVPRRSPASTGAARPRRRPGPRRSTTRSRRVSISSG